MKITKKYYDKRKHKFYIERTCNDGHILTNEYESFNGFYKGAKSDLNFADLIDYDFEGINLARYNFSGARLSSETRKNLIFMIMIFMRKYDKTFVTRSRYMLKRFRQATSLYVYTMSLFIMIKICAYVTLAICIWI